MNKTRILYWILSGLLIVSCLVSVSIGSVSIEIKQIFSLILNRMGFEESQNFTTIQENVFWILRFPRVLFGILVGVALGVSGVSLQGIFRNPLVDSGLIGIASGASLLASCFIVLSSYFSFLSIVNAQLTMAFVAFVGAAVTAFLVYRVSLYNGKINITMLILAGVALNAVSGSLTGLLTYFADDRQLRDITFWTLGSLSGATWLSLSILAFFVLIPAFILMRYRNALNAFALGEKSAYFIGVDTKKVKFVVLLCSTAMVGATVAFSGIIGFVGLVIPHILRLMIGPNHRALMPLSALAGALLICLADLVSRTLINPIEIPIGIITSIIGAPILLLIILKQKRNLFV
ncbi:MAG: iron ABC transporter permease [Crocinitomicaceae bacterium]|nr:iron ABC transporter permease [Crocinitomicaceae bacterium]